jgi:hypothetical protein
MHPARLRALRKAKLPKVLGYRLNDGNAVRQAEAAKRGDPSTGGVYFQDPYTKRSQHDMNPHARSSDSASQIYLAKLERATILAGWRFERA